MAEEVSQEVYNNALVLLSQDRDGSLKKALESILEWERNHPAGDPYSGFEWHMVFCDPRTLNSMVTRRILRVTFKSNKCTMYRAVDVKALEKALADYEGSFVQEIVEERIPSDLFEPIVAHEDKKHILMRSLQSEKPLHCLLWGSISSAKSMFLEELSRLPQSRLILGSALTRAGLFDILFNERPKYLIIDELEKIESTEDLAALLSLMERGLVTESKYRRHRSIRLKTWVYGACNDITRLPKELLSRFLLLRFRDYTPDEFYDVSVSVLTKREGISEPLAIYIAEKVLGELKSLDVRDCVKVARLLKQHTKEEVDEIVAILKRQK